MDLQLNFTNHIVVQQLFRPDVHLLLAVSGGLDSVVLCHLCKSADYNFSIAHCNFGLRGEESDRDEHFVRALAHKYNVPFYVSKFNTTEYALQHKLSIQVAARELRYKWFYELIDKNKEKNPAYKPEKPGLPAGDYIVTAHHLDDNIETVMMNFFKGSGIMGLTGIKPKRGHLIRPLLFASREDILLYAEKHDLDWVHDSTNDDVKYTRNFFRNELIPSIEKVIPQIKENIGDNIVRFNEVEQLYQQAISFHKKKLLFAKNGEWHIPVLKLKHTQPLGSIIYELTKPFGFDNKQVPEIIKLLDSESGKFITSHTHRILKNRAWLVISKRKSSENSIIVIGVKDESVQFDGIIMELKEIINKSYEHYSKDPQIAFVDADTLKYPLLLRKWKAGDYFYPLGMTKMKKVARFLIDQKLSLAEKENVWILESNKRIVWIVGHRIDNRFKITETTRKILRLTLSSPS